MFAELNQMIERRDRGEDDDFDGFMQRYGDMFPDNPRTLDELLENMERLHDFEDLDRSMRGEYAGASLEDVDEEALRRTLGEAAARDLRRLKQIERTLEQAGLVSRREGRLEVTPKGARKLGERALVKVFERLRRDREGTHDAKIGRAHV